jgi:hypothetical protein
MSFDAVDIEYAFATMVGSSIGARGTDHDADVFRAGDPKELAKALKNAVNALRERVGAISFDLSESDAGEAKARLDVAINRLEDLSDDLASQKDKEPFDYHWEIIGALISMVASLLETLERRAV